MKIKSLSPKTITCLSITDKAVKFVQSKAERSVRKILSLRAIPLKDRSDEELEKVLAQIFKGQKQKDLGRFILLIPRQLAAQGYCYLPSTKPEEIGQMARLQAAKQLPFEPQAMILGYQPIGISKEGYTDLALIIVHQDIVKKYLRLLEKYKVEPQEIILDSQGIGRWFNLQKGLRPQGPVMMVDLDLGSSRLDILSGSLSIYSRAFALSLVPEEYKMRLIDEIDKSLLAYKKEEIGLRPEGIFFTGAGNSLDYIDEDFIQKLQFQCAKYEQNQGIIFKTDPAVRLNDLVENSFASLLGMALSIEKPSFNLLPENILAKREKSAYQSQMRKTSVLVLLIITTIALGMFLSITVRKKIIRQLTQALQGVSLQADSIEAMARKLKLIREQSEQSQSCLQVLSEIFQLASDQLSLASFSYDVNSSLTLKGQAKTLAGVFNFVNTLEASALFKDVQVRHSSKRKIKNEEVADFEIVCPIEKR